MKQCHTLIGLLCAIGAQLASPPAQAFSTGITGKSGKQGSFCSECHSGGETPAVALELVEPAAVAPGTMATFRFTVTSARAEQKAAGLNVAASAGTLAIIAGQGARLVAGEITHSAPKPNTDGKAEWLFTWQAPATPGAYTLFAAGNSVDKHDTSAGDSAAITTLQIDVMVAAPTATPTSEPTSTATELPTATQPESTNTPTLPESTATPTATATESSQPMCTGDCDSSGEVTVDEIVRGVNIALGSQALSACEPFDRNADQQVTVDEIVDAIQRALGGC